jgi:antitoxin ParD1/3/4
MSDTKESTTINVSLPTPMRSYLESRVKADGFGSISDLIRALIREDQKRQAKEDLERRLLAGLDSGEATPMTAADWDEIRTAVKTKIASRAKMNE